MIRSLFRSLFARPVPLALGIFAGGLAFMVAAGMVYVGAVYTGTNEFCVSCHSMRDAPRRVSSARLIISTSPACVPAAPTVTCPSIRFHLSRPSSRRRVICGARSSARFQPRKNSPPASWSSHKECGREWRRAIRANAGRATPSMR